MPHILTTIMPRGECVKRRKNRVVMKEEKNNSSWTNKNQIYHMASD